MRLCTVWQEKWNAWTSETNVHGRPNGNKRTIAAAAQHSHNINESWCRIKNRWRWMNKLPCKIWHCRLKGRLIAAYQTIEQLPVYGCTCTVSAELFLCNWNLIRDQHKTARGTDPMPSGWRVTLKRHTFFGFSTGGPGVVPWTLQPLPRQPPQALDSQPQKYPNNTAFWVCVPVYYGLPESLSSRHGPGFQSCASSWKFFQVHSRSCDSPPLLPTRETWLQACFLRHHKTPVISASLIKTTCAFHPGNCEYSQPHCPITDVLA